MKKLVLSISLLLTLGLGLVSFRVSAVSLTAEEETLAESLTATSDALTTSCSDDLSGEEYVKCLEDEDDYANSCTEDLENDPSSECYIDLAAHIDNDGESDASEIEDFEETKDEDFLAGFAEEETEEEEGEPASIIPVVVATVLGLIIIIALTLAGKKK